MTTLAPLIVITGTGTEIGKTFVASALVAAWANRSGAAIAGIKPIESGEHEAGSDVFELGQVSTFHVTRFTPPYLLMDPVSPHLSARREGRSIDLAVVIDWVGEIRRLADGVVVELAGGLFSPLRDDGTTNADLIKALQPSRILLVAPDRLGVLHDVLATTKAARAEQVAIDGVVLSAAPHTDPSAGSNGEELALVLHGALPVLLTLPRCTREQAAAAMHVVVDALNMPTRTKHQAERSS